MRQSLALSYERVSPELLAHFHGIGMVRGEYVFRGAGRYPAPESVAALLVPYLAELASLGPGTIWYRTMDADTAECNVLEGVDEVIMEHHRGIGLRGIRRAMRFPDAFAAELAGVARVRQQTGADIGVMFPFVSRADELAWAVEQTRRVVGECPVGVVIEIPGLLLELDRVMATGVRRLVIGCAELSAMLLAEPRVHLRPVRPSPALLRAVENVTEAARGADAETAVAGYLHPDLVAACVGLGVDERLVHYADLPGLLGGRFAELPDLHVRADIERRTREAIARFAAARAAGPRRR